MIEEFNPEKVAAASSWGVSEPVGITDRASRNPDLVDFPKPLHAMVLLKTETTRLEETRQALASIRGVVNSKVVYGTFDFIVTVGADRLEDIGEIVIRDIQGIPSVIGTTTLVWLG